MQTSSGLSSRLADQRPQQLAVKHTRIHRALTVLKALNDRGAELRIQSTAQHGVKHADTNVPVNVRLTLE